MAIVIRPVRGEVQQQRFQPSKNLLRIAQASRQDLSGIADTATNALRVIQDHQQKLENERINNKVLNTEIMFMGEAEKAIMSLKEAGTVFTEEETEKQLNTFSKDIDRKFFNLYKNDPKAAIKGRFYAEKSKLEFMTEQNRLRNNQILAESANRVYLKEQEVVKGFGRIPENVTEPSTLQILNSGLQVLQPEVQANISTTGDREAMRKLQESVTEKFYNRAIIRDDKLGNIDIEKSRRLLEQNNVGGKEIPREIRRKFKGIIDDAESNIKRQNEIEESLNNVKVVQDVAEIIAKDGALSREDIKKAVNNYMGTPQEKNSFRQGLENNNKAILERQPRLSDPRYNRQITFLIENEELTSEKVPFVTEDEADEGLRALSLLDRFGLPITDKRSLSQERFDSYKLRIKPFKTDLDKTFDKRSKAFFEEINPLVQFDLLSPIEGAGASRIAETQQELEKVLIDRVYRKNISVEDVFAREGENSIYEFFEKNKDRFVPTIEDIERESNEYINRVQQETEELTDQLAPEKKKKSIEELINAIDLE